MRVKNFYMGITGHRVLRNEQVINFVKKQIKKTLLDIKQEQERIIVLTSIAEGADTLFTEIAIKLDLKFEAVIPYANYEEDFNTHASRQRYKNLLQQATKIHRLSFQKRSNKAYLTSGKWIVSHCDLLIAVWNGLPAAGKGGTGDVVDFAMQEKLPIIHIHTINKTLHRIEYTIEKHGQV